MFLISELIIAAFAPAPANHPPPKSVALLNRLPGSATGLITVTGEVVGDSLLPILNRMAAMGRTSLVVGSTNASMLRLKVNATRFKAAS